MFLNSVNILFVGDSDSYWGMAIAWGTQIEKNHIVLSVPKSSEATLKIIEKKIYTVSVLSGKQLDIARQYGGSQQNKFVEKDINFLEFGKWSTPVVKNASEHILCKLMLSQEINNQVLVVGKVLEYVKLQNMPILVYEQSDYFV